MQRRTLLVCLLALLAVALSVVPVLAQDGQPDATVVPDMLNMRHGPGSEYAIVVMVPRGAALTLLAQDDLPNNGIWVLAQTGSGTQGWVMSDFLTIRAGLDITALPVQPAPESLGTSPDAVPVEGGDPNAAPADETEAPAADAPADGFPEGTGVPAITTTEVNLRAGPGTGYQLFVTLAPSTNILAKGRTADNTWIFINANGQDGWVYVSYIRLTSGYISNLPLSTEIVAAGAAPAAADDSAASTTGGAVPAPVAGGPGLSGFGYGGHVDSFAYPNLMAHAGMSWAKRQIRFAPGTPGSVAAGAIDQAHANGFKILLSVVGHPNDINQPGYFDEYARFVSEVAALGPDAIEVWNEMNIDREWPTGRIDPNLYTQLLAQAYNAIKSANANVAVISGAPSPTGAEGAFGTDRVWNDDRYVRGMAAAGAAQYMDCLGAHYNEGIISPSQTSGDPRGEYYSRYFWGMVNTYWSAFGGARPICFTELGYVTPEGFGPLPGGFAWGSDTSVGEQAAWIAEAVRLARNSGKVRLVIIWNVDFTQYEGDPMAGYAIVRPGGVCPACDALAGIR
jgi:uncharacterized protein YraI